MSRVCSLSLSLSLSLSVFSLSLSLCGAQVDAATVSSLQKALADADALTRKAERREKACKKGYENEIAELKATIERLKANAARGVDLKAENRLPLRRESTGSNGSPEPRPRSAS